VVKGVEHAGACLDSEEALFAPSGSPGVLGNPIVSIIGINTPSNDLDGVVAEEAVGGWLVDTSAVIIEVSVDGHPGGDWSIGLEVILNSGNGLVVDDGASLDVVQWGSIGACSWATLLDAGVCVAGL